MKKTLILKGFKEIGLSDYEAKSYLSLLERETLTVAEVSRFAGIPRANAYEALDRLMSKGLCTSKPGKTKMYCATDPELLKEKFIINVDKSLKVELANLKEKERDIIEQSRAAKEKIDIMVKELKPSFENSRLKTNPLDYIEIIKDPYQMHKKFMQLGREAKVEILSFTKPPYSGPREWVREQCEQKLEPHQEGIENRCIYEIPKNDEEFEWWFEAINAAVKEGEKARVIEELPMKMAIFDSRIVIMGLVDPTSKGTSLTTQIVEHPDLAKSLKILFQTLWQQAEDYHILKR
jgi:sugar-specific transcriptional regulator TrmB